MSEIKQRDYMFDTFRGLLMWSIPISHFTRVAGHFSQASLSGVIYITINVFVMQAFVFLSGYFSKKPDRARETAFHTFLWPYLLCIPFFYCVRHIIWGNAHLYLNLPPFALWYLFALFFYRFFLKDYIKIPYVFEISMLVYMFAGQVPFFSDTWALGRMVSYFPFFLLGYYCDKDTLKRIRSLKRKHCWILAFCVKDLKVGFYLLKSPACELGIDWYWDILGRIIIFCLACGWIVLMLNILPGKMNYVAYVGMNTMPVYIFHLIVRYLVKKYTIFFGVLPENWAVYYVMIFALAGLCVFVFTTKPVIWIYDTAVEGSYQIFCWFLRKIQAFLGLLHRPAVAVCQGVIGLIDRADGVEEKTAVCKTEEKNASERKAE